MKQILVLVPVEPRHKKILENAAPHCHFTYSSNCQVTSQMMREVNIIVGNVEPKHLEDCKNLELLQLNSAGANPYIPKGVMPGSAVLTCATGAYGLALSEHMLAMLLAMKKRLYQYYDNQKASLWQDEGRVTGIYGTRTLVVGMGDIGTEFAKKMKGMGSYVVGIRRRPSKGGSCADEIYTLDELEEQLPLADTVALTLPGTEATFHLMNEQRLLLMKPGAFLLNIGRGSAVDSDALCRVMEDGRLAGAALDVTEPEPLPQEHPLWKAPGVFITPHISGEYHMIETLDRIVQIAADNLERYLKGQPLGNVIDFDSGYSRG